MIIPLGDRSLPSVIAALGPDVPADRRGTDLRAHRQREDRHRLPPVRHRRAQRQRPSTSRRYYGITHRTCVPVRPRVEGRLGVDGEAGQGRPGADRVQPLRGATARSPSWSRRAASSTAGSTTGPTRSPVGPPPRCSRRTGQHLHPIPDAPYTAAFGESRTVGWSSTVSFRGARYSVPHAPGRWPGSGCGLTAGEVVIVAGEGSAATEVARHRPTGPGPGLDQ